MSKLAGLIMLIVLLTGCSTVPKETPQTIAEREAVLMQVPVTLGRIPEPDAAVFWEGTGQLVLTPTTLYFTQWLTHQAYSYAMMTSVSVESVPLPGVFGMAGSLPDQLLIQVSRPVCRAGCVFRLANATQAQRAAALINARLSQVDVFGHLRKSGAVWLSSGSRNAPAWWQIEPQYLLQTDPAQKKAIEHWFCEQTGCNGSGRSGSLYASALEPQLVDGPIGDYTFRMLRGVTVNPRAELDTASLTQALGRVDPSVDSLLVSDLYSIELRERISADYVISVEATYSAFVDYFDVAPLKDGQFFWKRWTVTRPITAWLTMSESDFAADVATLAGEVALQIRSDLADPPGSASIEPN